MSRLTWKFIEASNVHVLMHNDVEVGFITKPKDTKTDKNAWRIHKGIGETNEFIGHALNKGKAKATLGQYF